MKKLTEIINETKFGRVLKLASLGLVLTLFPRIASSDIVILPFKDRSSITGTPSKYPGVYGQSIPGSLANVLGKDFEINKDERLISLIESNLRDIKSNPGRYRNKFDGIDAVIFGDYIIFDDKYVKINLWYVDFNKDIVKLEEAYGNLGNSLVMLKLLGDKVKAVHEPLELKVEDEDEEPNRYVEESREEYGYREHEELNRFGVFEEDGTVIVAVPEMENIYYKGEFYEANFRLDTMEGRKMAENAGGYSVNPWGGRIYTVKQGFQIGILRINVKDCINEMPIAGAKVTAESLVYRFESANITDRNGNCILAIADSTMWTNPDEYGSEFFADRTLLKIIHPGYMSFNSVFEFSFFEWNDRWHIRKYGLEFEGMRENDGSMDISVNVYM